MIARPNWLAVFTGEILRVTRFLRFLLVAPALLVASHVLLAAPGDLDATFAGDGRVRLGFGGGDAFAYAVALQTDGKILMAGTASASITSENLFAVTRYFPDGSLDPSFGDAGVALTNVAPMGTHGYDVAYAVGVQADGKIVAAGSSVSGGNNDFAVARYNPDGSLDSSFDGDGRVTTDFGGNNDRGTDLAIQSDGKILVAGAADGNFAVARYNPDGSLDGTFGNGGKRVLTALFDGTAQESHMRLQSDGKILVAGSPTSFQSTSVKAFYVVRLNPADGSYDTGFGSGGLAARGVFPGDGGTCTAIAVQIGDSNLGIPDLIVAGGYAFNGTREVFALIRFTGSGMPDPSFDGDGVVTTDVVGVNNATARISSMFTQGRPLQARTITVGGGLSHIVGSTAINESVIVRYNSNGSLDTTLDGDGVLPFAAFPNYSDVALAAPSGKILATGGGAGTFALAQFTSSGAVDTTFDSDGKRTDELGPGESHANGVAVQPDGKVVVAGLGGLGGGYFAAARLNTDGTPDLSFAGDGKADIVRGYLNAVGLQADGKIVAAGFRPSTDGNIEAAVARYNTDGSFDTSFGGGVVASRVGSSDVANAVAVQTDGKIVTAGRTYTTREDVLILRFNSNGTPDNSFDFDGRVVASLGPSSNIANAVAIQPDGKIVIAGSAFNGFSQFLVARFLPNGLPDTSFDGEGVAFIGVGPGHAFGNALVLDGSGRILVAGYSLNGTNSDVTVVRLNSNGSLDSSFGTGGKVVTSLSDARDLGNAIALQPDGKIVVAATVNAKQTPLGTLAGSYGIVRYLSDGTLDTTYGNGGKVVFGFQENNNNVATGIALDANANAVVVGEADHLFGIARILAGPLAAPSTLANVSTRLAVQTGDNALIGGFIITGTQPKKVILRALGPSVGLPGTLANATLELYSGSTLIGANDDWKNQPDPDRQAVIDSTISPSDDLESALVRTLPANGTNYTAIVRGANGGTGIGVVEAYDLDRSVDSKLANISTRGFVQTGDNVLIAGTIILGETMQRIIVRAIGPSLPIAGKLENPSLELRDQNGGLIEANDDWVNSPNKQAIIDSTIPPSNDLESAIVATLNSNGANYTAIVRGVGDTTGIGVVEVYALP